MTDTILTRFGNRRYNHFKVAFLNMSWEIKLIDADATFPENDDGKLVEQFKVSVTNKEKTISYYFYNSIMEREISKAHEGYDKNLSWNLIKSTLKGTLRGWGRYDKDLGSSRKLEMARIKNLFYSIVQCFATDVNNNFSSFDEFCDNFGYEKDSRKAYRIFERFVELDNKIKSLLLDEEQMRYLCDTAMQETDDFMNDIVKALTGGQDENKD